MEEIRSKLRTLKHRFIYISKTIDPDKLRQQINILELAINKPNFWQNQSSAQKISKQLSSEQKLLSTMEQIKQRIDSAIEISDEELMFDDLKKETKLLETEIEELELELYLSAPYDKCEAIVSIHGGTGGVEAMDWAAMLYRMYQRFFEKNGWEYEITDEIPGEEAGF